MENCYILFEKNIFDNKKTYGNKYIYKGRNRVVDAKELKRIILEVGSAIKGNTVRKIVFDYEKLEFADKLCYILFECLVYSLIGKYTIEVVVKCKREKNGIHTAGIKYSPLKKVLAGDSKTYINDFLTKKKIEGTHFRVITEYEENKKSEYFSVLYSDIVCFLENIYTKESKYIEDLSETIVELVDNASEHGKTSCLLDIDVSSGFTQKGVSEDVLYDGINVVILNLSDNYIWENVRYKCLNNVFTESERYMKVQEAYNTHKYFFGDTYNEEMFFTLAALQDRITGRLEESITGGTGLTKLIQSLQKQSAETLCYLVSGSNIIIFENEYLTQNNDNWVGMNYTCDFIYDIPDRKLFAKSDIYLPGVAYNLTFVVNQEGGI